VIAQPVLTNAASALVGRPVQVVCSVEAQPEDYGYADIAGSIIHVRPWVCGNLELLAAGYIPLSGGATRATAEAALVLAHEAGHLRLGLDERKAECFGLGSIHRLVRLLGAGLRQTTSLVRYARQADQASADPCLKPS